jgi:hypothetical protein
MLTTGALVLRTGTPVAISPWQGFAAALMFGLLILGEYVNVGFDSIHYIAHGLLELCCLLLSLSAAMPAALDRLAADPELRSRVRASRIILDSVGIFSIGIILSHHIHDLQPLAVIFHLVQAYMVMILGVVVGLVAAAAAPAGGRAGPGLRLLHAFCWMANGTWLAAMSGLMYVWPGRRGLHHVIYGSEDPAEASSVYLTLTLCAAAMVVVVGEVAGGPRQAYALADAGSPADGYYGEAVSLVGPRGVPALDDPA